MLIKWLSKKLYDLGFPINPHIKQELSQPPVAVELNEPEHNENEKLEAAWSLDILGSSSVL